MPTNRRTLIRERRQLDEYETAELLSLRPALLAGYGFEPIGTGQFDEDRMREAWREHETELLRKWIDGWRPESDFANFKEIGCPGSRPPGWWKFANKHPRKPGDDEPRHLTRYDLWLPGEKERWFVLKGLRSE